MVVTAPSLNTFKNRLDGYFINAESRYEYYSMIYIIFDASNNNRSISMYQSISLLKLITDHIMPGSK
jgi:hypothetical protein